MARLAKVVMCNVAGCRVLVRDGGTKCDKHKKVNNRAPRVRDKFLDTEAWRTMSKAKLAETPWCEQCERDGKGQTVPAIDVDHILPRKTHGHLALAFENLQSLCLKCHKIKTNAGL